ncbi:MAG: caspase family protein [Chitinophagales bacterium]|nr:caspase family protein [Chitinophagales bacterium]
MLNFTSSRHFSLLIVLMFLFFGALANPGILIRGTYVLATSQYPSAIKKIRPQAVYVVYKGPVIKEHWRKQFFSNDTILQLRGFMDSARNGIKAYRLVFKSGTEIDSVWQINDQLLITDKAWNLAPGLLDVVAVDETGKTTDRFIFNYGEKFKLEGKKVPGLEQLLRQEEVYTQTDRNRYATGAAWVLSVGIDNYTGGIAQHYRNCESDARSYNEFFRNQFMKAGHSIPASFYHGYLLTGEKASRAAILETLREIAERAAPGDYFIFNFSGLSYPLSADGEKESTCFFPWDSAGFSKEVIDSKRPQAKLISERLISLKVLQEYFQMIPAKQQLLITESGPTRNFKTEFLRTLMQNSPLVSGLLNKNRIIMVPEGFGLDNLFCKGKSAGKGPLNFYLTSLDSTLNIFNIFLPGMQAEKIVHSMKNHEIACEAGTQDYFDVFFEQTFLRQYRDVFGEEESVTRGLKVRPAELTKELSDLEGKRYALVIGTDHYRGKGWNPLSNPIADARAVAAELKEGYGFEIRLLEDQPMDSIYAAVRYYYNNAQPNDQLVIYVAGHGDMDEMLLDDGFIVCHDSRSVEDDPMRNSYIPYMKLKKMLNNIPARQVLVLLDVCHGGVFDQKVFDQKFSGDGKREGVFAAISNRNVVQLLKDKLPLRTRKFLSSVGTEPAFDGKAGKHSPFANLLLQVLRSRGENANGILTLSDIYAVLQTASLNETATLRITPAMDNFGRFDPFSEFIFIPVAEKK